MIHLAAYTLKICLDAKHQGKHNVCLCLTHPPGTHQAQPRVSGLGLSVNVLGHVMQHRN